MPAALIRKARAAQAFMPALAVFLLLAAGAAWACPICFSGRVPMLGQKIDAADAVVLATPLGNAGPYRVTTPIKGDTPNGMLILDASPAPADFVVKDFPSLLIRNKSSQQWSALGSVNATEADWLRSFAAGGPSPGAAAKKSWPRTLTATAEPSDEDWAQRLALVAPALESPGRLIAEIAYGEIARAPYRLLLGLKGTRDPAEIRTWLDTPELAARQPAYTLLLGVTGGPAELAYIEARIAQDRASHKADDLAALITASLEIGGPGRLDAITTAFLTDKTRSLPEIEAALLALNVQGNADAAVPRARIVEAYGAFVRAHPAMAGFVVQDLSDWNAYGVAADVEAAAASGAVRDPASLYAVMTYLKRDPSQAASAGQPTGSNLPP